MCLLLPVRFDCHFKSVDHCIPIVGFIVIDECLDEECSFLWTFKKRSWQNRHLEKLFKWVIKMAGRTVADHIRFGD